MAIYKPTDCSPFNGTFDIDKNSADLPIIFECKVDTSNTIVTGYSIEIYDSNNGLIFPSTGREQGPVKSNVTYLSDLRPYVTTNFLSLLPNLKNINSGLNGSYLEIPFYVEAIDATAGSTVSRNQMSANSTPKLVEGQTYTWKITLYQGVKKNDDFPPANEKVYDMTVASGTVIGSNEKRIQTALIDSDDRVVDNLVLLDKFVQPIQISELDGYNPTNQETNPVTSWTGTVPTTFSMTRSLITGYDSTYGYVYPSTAEGNAFADGQIVPENANGFQIFKNGNNPSNLGATDMVEFIYDSGEFNGKMTWKTSAAKSEQSYWEQVYLVDTDPNGVFYPLKGDGYSSFALTGSERIIFNNIQDPKVQYDGIYYGSPYNGIFEPHFSSKKIDGETSVYQVTVVWNRTSDATNWGTLSNKIVYCRRDGKNYEINTTTQVGEINKTPFKFVEEKPVRIFDTATVTTDTIGEKDLKDLGNNSRIFNTNSAISSILSVTNNSGVDVTKDCGFEIGNNYVIYTSSSTIPSDLTFSVKYIPYSIQDYAGIIFYNKQTTSDSDTGIVYIRPSININKNMIFKEVTTTANPTWFNINYFNKDYNYITYTGNQKFSPTIDKTRYQIKGFYKDSDYNPFSIYKDPTIVSTISGNIIESGGFENNITTRNFMVTSTYDQNNYIQWKSYQWFLYDSAKRTILKKTDEQYDGEITATFYGLDPQKYYILSLVLQTNTGKIIEIDYVIYTDFTESAEQKDLVEAEFDCDTLAMKANLKLVNTVLAPDADEYLSGSTAPTKDTAYYYDQDNFYKKNGEVIASIDSGTGVLKITGQNAINYSKSFSDYAINSSTRAGSIQTNSDEIVIEGSFVFSEDYNGNIFSISRDDNSSTTVEISIPQALTEKDPDGFVDISNDINKIKIKNGSYLKIIGSTNKISDVWQNSNKFHNTSIWKKADQIPSGDRINVANFKYAEIDFVNQNDTPYPYEKGTVLETITGKSIEWNQMLDRSKYPTTTTVNGVTFKNNGDGSITVNGTATDLSVFLLFNYTDSLISEHKYLIFGSPNDASDKAYIQCYDNINLEWLKDTGGGGIAIFPKQVVSPNGSPRIRIRIAGGYTANNLVFKPQFFDLTQMFGAGNEPATPEEFWSYFETNKIYLKNIYRNVSGPYNSYDSEESLKNPINPKQQLFNINIKDGDVFRCNKTKENPNGVAFNINQPDKLIWLDYTPTEEQKSVVIDANENGASIQLMTVMEDKLLVWDDNSSWKDGIYVESGREKTLIGQIFVNDEVVKSEYLDAVDSVKYSNSGLTQQIQIPQNINERKEIANYEFAFRIFVNTNNFSVDQLRSRCYVKKIS